MMRVMRGSLQTAVNSFFYLAKCYWLIVAMEICRRTALKKKWRVPVRGKYDAFTFIFASILNLFIKKKKKKERKKETGDEMEGKTKWRMFLFELLEKRSFSVIHKRLFADLFLAM